MILVYLLLASECSTNCGKIINDAVKRFPFVLEIRKLKFQINSRLPASEFECYKAIFFVTKLISYALHAELYVT